MKNFNKLMSMGFPAKRLWIITCKNMPLPIGGRTGGRAWT